MADDIYKNLREFRSPRDYVYQECVVKDRKIYQVKNNNGTSGRWIPEDWQEIALTSADFTDVNNSLAILSAYININIQEIDKLNRLLGLLLFELIEQGIRIQSKELIEELELYFKNADRS